MRKNISQRFEKPMTAHPVNMSSHVNAGMPTLLAEGEEAILMRRPCKGQLVSLLRSIVVWRDTFLESQAQRQIAQVADLLVAEMDIWQIEDSTQSKACIASWPTRQSYRGYLLCSDQAGHTCLLDLCRAHYLSASPTCLLQIDGLEQARRFLDALSCTNL